jgi:hypothetical protein
LGFVSNQGTAFEALNVAPGENPVRMSLLLFARWYRMWILAGVAVLGSAAIGLVARRPGSSLVGNRGVNVVAVTVLYLAAWQFLIMSRWKLQLAVGYLPQFAILVAICLGWWMAVVLDALAATPRLKRAAFLGLCAFFLVAPAQSRPLSLPLRVSWQDPPVTALYGLAADLSRVIPPGSSVFHLGGPLGLYVAGFEPYLRQERDVAALATNTEDDRFAKSGFWSRRDIRRWLTRDSEYAVIAAGRVALYRGTRLESDAALIQSLLTTHFTRVAVLDRYPALAYEVYRRTR